MPLGDFFLPEPPLVCPLCGRTVAEWEGFGGPGLFLVFKQGEAAPVDKRLESQVGEDPDEGARLEDGRVPLFGQCKGQHSIMVEAIVEDGVWSRVQVVDVEAGDGMPLTGGWVLWTASAGRYAVSTLVPTAEQAVVPASITAIGYNDACVLATRRTDTRDPDAEDEWYVVDVGKNEVLGPVPDQTLKALLAERKLAEPAVMRLPEDVAYARSE